MLELLLGGANTTTKPKDPPTQLMGKLLASDGAANDLFGYAVSLSGDGKTALVGAYADDDRGANSGSAYVFKTDGTTWRQVAKLTASDGGESDQFAQSVSISGDGSTALIGSRNDDDRGSDSGAAFVFKTTDGTTWRQVAKLTASDGGSTDQLGFLVSLSSDGTTALVSSHGDDDRASGAGAAYIFKTDGATWRQVAKLTASDGAASDMFGYALSISGNGSTAVVGSYQDDDLGISSGSAYVFKTTNGTTWSQVAKLTASDGAANDQFGQVVCISADGSTVLVNSPGCDTDKGVNAGAVYVFQTDGSTWRQVAKLTASDGAAADNFGNSVAITEDGSTILVGSRNDDDLGTNSGSVYVFKFSGGGWYQTAKIIPSDGAANDYFGYACSISADGTSALIGAYADDDKGTDSGSVYIYSS